MLFSNKKGNREFVKILMLHRDYPSALVTESVKIAMAYNVYGYDGVLNILGQLLVSCQEVDNNASQQNANRSLLEEA